MHSEYPDTLSTIFPAGDVFETFDQIRAFFAKMFPVQPNNSTKSNSSNDLRIRFVNFSLKPISIKNNIF